MSTSSKLPIFCTTAWYSFIAPFVAASIPRCFLIVGLPRHPAGSPAEFFLRVAACILYSSVLASVISLFGIPKHGWRTIVWKSAAGLGLSILVLAVLVAIGAGMAADQ
jgi:hypothetical protein